MSKSSTKDADSFSEHDDNIPTTMNSQNLENTNERKSIASVTSTVSDRNIAKSQSEELKLEDTNLKSSIERKHSISSQKSNSTNARRSFSHKHDSGEKLISPKFSESKISLDPKSQNLKLKESFFLKDDSNLNEKNIGTDHNVPECCMCPKFIACDWLMNMELKYEMMKNRGDELLRFQPLLDAQHLKETTVTSTQIDQNYSQGSLTMIKSLNDEQKPFPFATSKPEVPEVPPPQLLTSNIRDKKSSISLPVNLENIQVYRSLKPPTEEPKRSKIPKRCICAKEGTESPLQKKVEKNKKAIQKKKTEKAQEKKPCFLFRSVKKMMNLIYRTDDKEKTDGASCSKTKDIQRSKKSSGCRPTCAGINRTEKHKRPKRKCEKVVVLKQFMIPVVITEEIESDLIEEEEKKVSYEEKEDPYEEKEKEVPYEEKEKEDIRLDKVSSGDGKEEEEQSPEFVEEIEEVEVDNSTVDEGESLEVRDLVEGDINDPDAPKHKNKEKSTEDVNPDANIEITNETPPDKQDKHTSMAKQILKDVQTATEVRQLEGNLTNKYYVCRGVVNKCQSYCLTPKNCCLSSVKTKNSLGPNVRLTPNMSLRKSFSCRCKNKAICDSSRQVSNDFDNSRLVKYSTELFVDAKRSLINDGLPSMIKYGDTSEASRSNGHTVHRAWITARGRCTYCEHSNCFCNDKAPSNRHRRRTMVCSKSRPCQTANPRQEEKNFEETEVPPALKSMICVYCDKARETCACEKDEILENNVQKIFSDVVNELQNKINDSKDCEQCDNIFCQCNLAENKKGRLNIKATQEVGFGKRYSSAKKYNSYRETCKCGKNKTSPNKPLAKCYYCKTLPCECSSAVNIFKEKSHKLKINPEYMNRGIYIK